MLDVMMAFAIANVPQVYDECDHNVMRLGAAAWLPRAVGALCR